MQNSRRQELACKAYSFNARGSRSRPRKRKGAPIRSRRPRKAAIAPVWRYRKELELKPYRQANGPASLIPIWQAVSAVNRKRAASGARRWACRARRCRVHQSRKVIRMKCGCIEGSAIAGNKAAWRDVVKVKAAGDIPFHLSHGTLVQQVADDR